MRVDPTAVNAWGLIFRNDNGFVGGVVIAQSRPSCNHTRIPVFPSWLNSFSTAGHSYSGFATVDPISTNAFLAVDHNTYAVSITLQRVTETCNPQVWVAFAEEIIKPTPPRSA